MGQQIQLSDGTIAEPLSCDGETAAIRIEVNADSHWFEGHFPGHPVLPGIVQVKWAVELAHRLLGFEGEPRDIRRLKYKHVIVPPGVLVVSLESRALGRCSFSISSDMADHSEGVLIF